MVSRNGFVAATLLTLLLCCAHSQTPTQPVSARAPLSQDEVPFLLQSAADQKVYDFLDSWLDSQMHSDTGMFLSHYTRSFNGQELTGTETVHYDFNTLGQRRSSILKPIDIDIEGLLLSVLPDNSVRASFVQRTRWENKYEVSYKELLLKPELAGNLKIDFEETRLNDSVPSISPGTDATQGRVLQITDTAWRAIKKQFGLTVAFYIANHDPSKRSPDENTFEQEAKEYTQDYGGLGINPATNIIELGKHGTCVSSYSELVDSILTIQKSILARYMTEKKSSKLAPEPSYTKIQNLAIFTHGMYFGIMLNPNHKIKEKRAIMYYDGLHSKSVPDEQNNPWPSNVDEFAKSIKNSLANKVRIHLFACNTARPNRLNEKTASKEEKRRGGKNSFAAALWRAIKQTGVQHASVYGHTTAGGATTNAYGRVYGGDAVVYGEAEEIPHTSTDGLFLFDYFYDEQWVQEQAIQYLKDPWPNEQRTPDQIRDTLLNIMWSRYAYLCRKEMRLTGKKLGMEIFMNAKGIAKALKADWDKYYNKDKLFQKDRKKAPPAA